MLWLWSGVVWCGWVDSGRVQYTGCGGCVWPAPRRRSPETCDRPLFSPHSLKTPSPPLPVTVASASLGLRWGGGAGEGAARNAVYMWGTTHTFFSTVHTYQVMLLADRHGTRTTPRTSPSHSGRAVSCESERRPGLCLSSGRSPALPLSPFAAQIKFTRRTFHFLALDGLAALLYTLRHAGLRGQHMYSRGPSHARRLKYTTGRRSNRRQCK